MVHRVHNRFFDCRERIVEQPGRLGTIWVLDDLFSYHVDFDVPQSVSYLLVQWAVKHLLNEFIAARSRGENHHVDLRAGNELPRFVMEEQHADISWFHEFFGPIHDVHQPTQIHQRHFAGIFVQVAANFFQVGLEQSRSEIVHVGLTALAVVEWHGRRQT